jgi:transposase InsO family protein
MRYIQGEKLEIIRLVEESDRPVKTTLEQLGISRASFYRWHRVYVDHGAAGLAAKPSSRRQFWNRISDDKRERVVMVALAKSDLSARELAYHITNHEGWFISESSVYRILRAYDLVTSPAYIVMSAADTFRHQRRHVHELWQTVFTYFRIIGWGWYYLSTVLDDYSRYIIAWSRRSSMGAEDVQQTLDQALAVTGQDHVQVRCLPRLLSDNGPGYVSKDLQAYLKEKGTSHTRGAPYHPQTQSKIERCHRTMKNIVKLRNYYQKEELERELTRFVEHYNNECVHESLNNMTPADFYHGRHREILTARQFLKMQTPRRRRCYNQGNDPGEEELIRPALIR